LGLPALGDYVGIRKRSRHSRKICPRETGEQESSRDLIRNLRPLDARLLDMTNYDTTSKKEGLEGGEAFSKTQKYPLSFDERGLGRGRGIEKFHQVIYPHPLHPLP